MSHLVNPLATPAQLSQYYHGTDLPTDIQETIFISTQCLTQAAGLLLGLSQSVTAQANVTLARFWVTQPMMAHEFHHVSAACIFLVAKMSATPRSPRDISNVYAYLLSKDSTFMRAKPSDLENDPQSYYQTESDYHTFHSSILRLEALLLPHLSFNTHVSLPHPLAITYLQTLSFLALPKDLISHRTIEYLNTALLSPQLLYLTHQPNELAVAAIYAAARDVGAKMPGCEWWEVFDCDREVLGFLVVGMRSLEGLMRRRRGEVPRLWEGVVTRGVVNGELRERGLKIVNGKGKEVDEEVAVMEMMDKR